MDIQEKQENNKLFKNKDSKFGPMAGSVIVILIIIIGGIYFWSIQIEKIKSNKPGENQTTENESLVTPKDDPVEEANAIERQLDKINFENLEAELNALDRVFSDLN